MTATKRVAIRILAFLLVVCIVPTMAMAQMPEALNLEEEEVSVSSGYSGGAKRTAGSFPVSRDNPGVAIGYSVSSLEELKEAVGEANGETVITVNGDIVFDGTIEIGTGKEITLQAGDQKSVLSINLKSQRHFEVASGGELTLASDNLILDGSDIGGGIRNEGTLILDGATIQNCYYFIVNRREHGGGVYNDGDFYLYSGTIKKSHSPFGGGVYNDGHFVMTGGSIVDNGRIESDDPGLNPAEIDFMNLDEMEYMDIRMRIEGCNGGGVDTNGTFSMTGGKINNNTAVDGGGVRVTMGSFEMSGGEISGNLVLGRGGGISMGSYPGTFIMYGGSISNNNVYENGGGINSWGSGSIVMQGGSISNNNAHHGNGGGINSFGSININSGSISNNNAHHGNGGGIFTYDYSLLHVGEDVIFSGNTASGAHLLTDVDDIETHNTYIKATSFSLLPNGEQAKYGYNNYDINYTRGEVAPDMHIVSFDSNGGYPEPEEQRVENGSNVAKPTNVDKQGHTLEGWYREDTGDRWEFTDPVTEDMTLVANWEINTYTVTFDADGGFPEPDDQDVEYGKLVNEPPVQPIRGEDEFLGWHTKDGMEWNFQDNTVTGDVKLIAHWKAPDVPDPIKYTITFDTDGGSPIPADQTVLEGGKTVRPVQPSKEGYVFGGWYNGVSEWDFDKDTVNTNITLTAKWTKKTVEPPVTPEVTEYTVSFNADGGTPVPQSQKVEKGEKAARPGENPSKSGYTFTGWYDGSELWDFDENTVERDMVLTAGWRASGSSGGDSGKDSGSNTPDDLDGNTGEETPGEGSTGGGSSSGSRDRSSSVSVGRDIYINDLDVPLANELLSIFEEDVPLAEINFFDIPDTGVKRSVAGLLAVGAIAMAVLAYKKED